MEGGAAHWCKSVVDAVNGPSSDEVKANSTTNQPVGQAQNNAQYVRF